ncbi:uncharacterized protein EV420DRAFT_1519479 [Desarmillaria tabescens]|uniref:F-box domain-containing protein n=1 Tax=Armillaria tabescens TaxID=1929756 RepID=A0AA39NDK0_ARMTA|nr:uncharacterized protein EV420DRAFT_1519479 [Desarmillaria tabescens]KAK0463681.1 hypothetical protein EV420DRAFT_1519479 [Desarmillaria tabescens]
MLSQHLYETIIDFCAEFEDRSTLLSCSLVCRSWVRRSRHHYFRTTYINSAERANSFLQLIFGPITSINSPEIRGLILGMNRGCVQDWFCEWLPELLRVLPGVTALSFSLANHEIHTALEVHPMPSGRDEGVFMAPFNLLPDSLRMTTLKLAKCHFFSLRQLFFVLSQFRLLEDLTLEQLRFKNTEPDTFIPDFGVYRYIQHLVYLKRLRIDTLALKSSRGEVSSYFAFAMPSVEALSLRMPGTKHEWLIMQQLLHGLRGSLVEVEWRECGDMEGDWSSLDSLQLNLLHVRAIYFSGIWRQSLDKFGRPPKSSVPLVLYRICGARELKDILLDVVDPDFVAAMNDALCSAIDKGLARSTFSNLTVIVPQLWASWIAARFPLAGSRGITLRVE